MVFSLDVYSKVPCEFREHLCTGYTWLKPPPCRGKFTLSILVFLLVSAISREGIYSRNLKIDIPRGESYCETLHIQEGGSDRLKTLAKK